MNEILDQLAELVSAMSKEEMAEALADPTCPPFLQKAFDKLLRVTDPVEGVQ